MERRALLAVAISLAILVLYQEVVLRFLYPAPQTSEGEAPPIALPEEPPEVAPPPLDVEVPAVESEQVAGRELIIDTDLYRAVVSTAGGRLVSFKLKQYRETVAADSPPQEIILPRGGEFPLALQLRGKETVTDSGVLYQSDRERIELTGGEVGSIELKAIVSGVSLGKRFEFRGDSYVIGLDAQATGSERFSELGVAWFEEAHSLIHPPGSELFNQVSVLQGKKLLHETFDNLADGKVLEKEIQWAAYDGRHFLAGLVPHDGQNLRVWLKERERKVEAMLLVPRSDGKLVAGVDIYVGPKDIRILEAAGHSLDRAVDLGYFSFVAVPLLHALKLSNGLTGNYGIDIILLTVVIKILFIPLTQRSFKSMKAMQKLQPQMAKIRERFKDTPEQMNKEIMELYRRHKVNPLGGCLPMVLQIPVFIGLYNALSNAVELRHAPFMFWINDLSAPDRLGSLAIPFISPPGIPVLTLFMGASMFVQQWMTPSMGDPAQQRIMMIMPIMFTFMFVSFPAGLTLYWLVNNVLTIGQQYVINRPER
jgi:YidC/Oxa1 family membrane protein insertase